MGSSPSAPTLDTGLNQQQIDLYRNNIGPISDALRAADRRAVIQNTNLGLNILTDTGETLNAGQLKKLRKEASQAAARIERLNTLISGGGSDKRIAAWQAELDKLTTASADKTAKIAELSSPDYAANRIRAGFADQYARRDNLLGSMNAAMDPTSEYARMQNAFARGLDARTSDGTQLRSVADIQAAQAARVADIQGAQAARVGDISAQMVGSGQLGGSLMNEAMRRMALQGRLSDQDARDVTQATRQGLAARGMAMGNAALGAELLNRDRFTRQRAFQDLGFAQGIQEQDLNRQQLNSNRALEAARANQSVAAQMSLAELDAEMRARQSNQQTATNLSLADLDAEMRARTANQSTAANMSIAQGQIDQNNNQFNAQQLTGNDRFNVGLLEQSAVRADQERLRQLGLGQDAYNFSMATDPKLMAVGLGNPYANLTGSTQAASQVLGTIAMNPMYSGGNAGTQGQNMQLIGTLGGGALAAGGTVAGAVII